MKLIPRCPSCEQGALREAWEQADVVSALAMPDARVVCVVCGHTFRLDKSTEWIKV